MVGLNICGFVVTSITKTHKVTDITVSFMRSQILTFRPVKWTSWLTLLQPDRLTTCSRHADKPALLRAIPATNGAELDLQQKLLL